MKSWGLWSVSEKKKKVLNSPGEKEILLMRRESFDRRRKASVREILEFLYANFLTKLWIWYNYKRLSSHMKPAPECRLKKKKFSPLHQNSTKSMLLLKKRVWKVTWKQGHIVWQGWGTNQDHTWPSKAGVIAEGLLEDQPPLWPPSRFQRDRPLLSRPTLWRLKTVLIP